MIRSVSVSNFKILEKFDGVPLKRLTLIGGKNDIGKTTFLESLFFYLDCSAPEVFGKFFSWRALTGTWTPKEVWEKFFYDFDFSRRIGISVDYDGSEKGQLYMRFLHDYEIPFQMPVTDNGITTMQKNFPALELLHSTNDVVDYHAHVLCQGLSFNYFIETNKLHNRLSIFYMGERMGLYERNAEYLGILDKSGEQDKILPLLKLFESGLDRLLLVNEGGANVIYADFGNKRKIPVNMLGGGFCRCLTMALVLATKNADVFLVDEVGSGVHYSFQEDLWNFLVMASELYGCQIIATTHSHDTIRAFSNVIGVNDASNFSYIRLGTDGDGIRPYVFTPDSLGYSLSSELEVR